jgi:hypothetical protein
MGWNVVSLRRFAALSALALSLVPDVARAQWVMEATMQVAQLDVETAEPNIVDVPCREATCSGTVSLLIEGVPRQFKIKVNVPPKAASIEISSDEIDVDLGGRNVRYLRKYRPTRFDARTERGIVREIVDLYERRSDAEEVNTVLKLPLRRPGSPIARVRVLANYIYSRPKDQ